MVAATNTKKKRMDMELGCPMVEVNVFIAYLFMWSMMSFTVLS